MTYIIVKGLNGGGRLALNLPCIAWARRRRPLVVTTSFLSSLETLLACMAGLCRQRVEPRIVDDPAQAERTPSELFAVTLF